MRVVFFVRDMCLGGVERCVASLAGELASRGYKVRVVMLGGSQNLWTSYLQDVDVVDLSGLWRSRRYLAWLMRACSLARESDVILAATFLMPLYMGWLVSLVTRRRLVAWVHGPFAVLDATLHMNPVHRKACQWIYRRLRRVVCVSHHSRKSLADWIGMGAPKSWVVIPNFSEGIAERSSGDAAEPARLLYVGRLAEEKKPFAMIEMMEQLKERGVAAKLTIVGNGPLEDELRSLVQKKSLVDAVFFAGYQSDVSGYYAQADMLVLLSAFEGCPMVVLEAMRAGLPVLSTDHSGTRELLEPMADLMIADSDDPVVLADKAVRILEKTEQLGHWMLQRSRAYTIDVFVKNWLDVLEQK